MSNKTPKPFHVGTRVRMNSFTDSSRVVACHKEWVWCENYPLYPKEKFVHADDGSPLGAWVPLKADGELTFWLEDFDGNPFFTNRS
jgi:hypothetical protein